jgi:hypothetical protein
MLSFMLSKQVTPMKLPVFMTILPTVFTIGFIASPAVDCPGYQKESALDAPGTFLLPKNRSYTKTYCFLLGNLAMIRMFGMDHYSLITFRNNTLCTCGLDNAKTYSIVLGSVYKDLADRQLRLIQNNRSSSKKIPRMDKRPQYRSLGRRRGSFSESQQSHSYLGS